MTNIFSIIKSCKKRYFLEKNTWNCYHFFCLLRKTQVLSSKASGCSASHFQVGLQSLRTMVSLEESNQYCNCILPSHFLFSPFPSDLSFFVSFLYGQTTFSRTHKPKSIVFAHDVFRTLGQTWRMILYSFHWALLIFYLLRNLLSLWCVNRYLQGPCCHKFSFMIVTWPHS